ncbi:metallophosphoesterase family protein [Paenibacillus nasutitermitis]|uniref:Serine/threonine protein phosphatase n=1 Tax=Paenibacillus nasutitermitis TaxID=1652958 RepID=A0A916YPR1_9BACL|nr:metallophosphoesterase family protein [Paenibacillus nasutitermitis]GGD55266.1 serine/threonine protein phosphatase [Paenibacillus nasutitermitis]
MDRIAVISDIHGNIPALEAVLADIRQRGITTIYCLGDLAGKGPGSDEAVDRVRDACTLVIRGNWDENMARDSEYPPIVWHQNKLGARRLDYLRELPIMIELHMSGRLIRLFHASPRSVHERIQPWDSHESRLSLFHASEYSSYAGEADVAGYGDIHNAFVQHLDGKALFNAGSVGNPLEMTQASYAILEGRLNGRDLAPFGIQLVRVPYDIELAVQQAVEAQIPELEAYVVELRTAVYRGNQKKTAEKR